MGFGEPTTRLPRWKKRSTSSIASMSGMALSTARRNRSPGGAGSRPRGRASRASETFACKSTADISLAHWSQVRHSSNRSIAGATTVALARPTRARLELLGHLALQGQHWSFPVGIGVYALDGLIFVAARHWVGLAFHVFVLIMIGKGFQVARQLDRSSTLA
jgi:hypothetical protein